MRNCHIVYIDPHLDRQLISKILSDGFNLKTILVSDLFRSQLKIQNELTKDIKFYMDSGQVIPVQLTDKLIEMEIDKTNGNILLEAYPRSVHQFESVGNLMALKGFSIDVVWYFKHFNFEIFVSDYYESKKQRWISKYGEEIKEKWFNDMAKMKNQIELLKSIDSYLWTEIPLTHLTFRDSVYIKEQIIKTEPGKMFRPA